MGGRAAAAAIQLGISEQRLVAHAPEGAPVAIQQSDDLLTWQPLAKGLVLGGELRVDLPTGGTRFFRAVPAETAVKFTSDSFSVEVNPALSAMPGDQVWRVPPQTVQVSPGTNFIAADLFDGRLHVLSRRLHAGAVYYARVVADTNGPTQVEVLPAEFPLTAIPKTKAIIANHRPLKVALIGDSLTLGGGVPDIHDLWYFLLLDKTGTANPWSLLPEVSPLRYNNFGVGGILNEYALVATRADSPVLNSGYDVAIVGFGANSGLGDAALVEAMVHALRVAGVEVILQTGEQRMDGFATPFLADEEALAGIADRQGCAVADTYAYMLEVPGTYSADKVHPSVLGQHVWAGSMRSLMNGLPQDSQAVVPASEFGSLSSLPEALRASFPNAASVQFVPTTSTGVRAAATFYNSLGTALGGLPTTAAITLLTNGQNATFLSDSACAVSLLTENKTGESAKLLIEYGNGQPGRALMVDGSFNPRINPAAAIGKWNTNLPVSLTVTVTNGLLRLTGVSFPVRH